jgi:hypothetical protein
MHVQQAQAQRVVPLDVELTDVGEAEAEIAIGRAAVP